VACRQVERTARRRLVVRLRLLLQVLIAASAPGRSHYPGASSLCRQGIHMNLRVSTGLEIAVAAILGGCATAMITVPEVAPNIAAPADQTVFLEALATGVQIYDCAAKPGQSGPFEWTFRAPEATLADRAGRSLGKHYAGPTWEAVDGSTAVGEAKARDQGPDPRAIPWLLLNVKSTSGNGILTQTKSVQRLKTVGGSAPSLGCAPENAGQVARVPYTATYYFYRTRGY
jgi:hypothetical protein